MLSLNKSQFLISRDENINWKSHIDEMSSNIWNDVGVLNRLKNVLCEAIRIILYNSTLISFKYYWILICGNQCSRNVKLFLKKRYYQYSVSNYNANSVVPFKIYNLLKTIDDIEDISWNSNINMKMCFHLNSLKNTRAICIYWKTPKLFYFETK